MAGDPLLEPLAALLNRNLAASGSARGIAEDLEGRSFEVRVTATPLCIRFTVTGGRVAVTAGGEGEPTASIEGSPLTLATLAGPDAGERIRAKGLRVTGDAETAQSFQRLFAAARPDFEEELSRVVGDAPAHHLARVARGAFGFGRRALDTLAHNMAEYLTEESRDLPAKPEVEMLLEGIDRLREDVDRFEARLARLERGTRA
jgi:ubiquinone biosynthesis protein UbiJ